ncbi:MAG: hypothetical protein FWH04_09355 [Oscillospiraceae bacterium]|nr:hypothetical protein [Oscillospiraceae bacterium]
MGSFIVECLAYGFLALCSPILKLTDKIRNKILRVTAFTALLILCCLISVVLGAALVVGLIVLYLVIFEK